MMSICASETAKTLFSQPAGLVIIDPGHGGYDPGAVVASEGREVLEKDITLEIALQVRDILESFYPDIDILLTREDDSFVSLRERARIANDSHVMYQRSKLFVSIHANAAADERAQGFEIWKLDERLSVDFKKNGVSEDSLRIETERENGLLNEELDLRTGYLAEVLDSALALSLADQTTDRGVKESRFYVLEYTYMPSVLIETGFMTNTEELADLMDDEYQMLISAAISSGIAAYIEESYCSER